jgi:drug/metabolite transporter (DMT)-like permease
MEGRSVSLSHALLMVVLVLFWGSSFVIVKLALREGLTPVAIATFRFLVAGGLFIIVLLVRKGLKSGFRITVDWKDFPTVLLLALTGVTFFFAAQYTGIRMAGASIAAILVCLLSPILISVFSAKIFKERLTKRQALGIGIAAVGTFTVVTGGTLSLQAGSEFFEGSLILLLTPFLWATYSLLGKRVVEKYDAFLVVAYVNMLGGLCLVPFSWAEGSLNQALTMSLHGWLAILFLSVTCSLLGYYLWFYVLKRVGAAVTSSFLFAEPLVTVLFAVMFVGELINLYIVVGGLFIFTGVYLVTRK